MVGTSPKSDLAARTVSAMVMLAVSGFALWAGGMAWLVFVLIIGIGAWFEWSALCQLIEAAAHGIPLAGFNVCGIPEILEKDMGILLDPAADTKENAAFYRGSA